MNNRRISKKKRRIFFPIILILFFVLFWRVFLLGFDCESFGVCFFSRAYANESLTQNSSSENDSDFDIVPGVQDTKPLNSGKQKIPKPKKELSQPTIKAILQEAKKLKSNQIIEMRRLKEDIDRKGQLILQQKNLLEVAEKKLIERQKKILEIEQHVQKLVDSFNQHERDSQKNLVSVYSTMKPKAVAAIFNTLDVSTLISFVRQMPPRILGPIFAAMDPSKVQMATQALLNQPKIAFNPTQDEQEK